MLVDTDKIRTKPVSETVQIPERLNVEGSVLVLLVSDPDKPNQPPAFIVEGSHKTYEHCHAMLMGAISTIFQILRGQLLQLQQSGIVKAPANTPLPLAPRGQA